MKRILILGRTNAVYRTAIVTKKLMDLKQDFSVTVINPDFFSSRKNLWTHAIGVIVYHFSALAAVFLSDIVYVTPMSHINPRCYPFAKLAKLLRKKLVFDFYFSGFETYVIDRKKVLAGSAQARNLKLQDEFAIRYGQPCIFLNKAEKDYYTELIHVKEGAATSTFLPLIAPDRNGDIKEGRTAFDRNSGPAVIAWWGRLGNPIHGIEMILDCAVELLNEGYPVEFHLFPAGSEEDIRALSAGITRRNLTACVFTDLSKNFSNGSLESFLKERADIALGQFGDTDKGRTVFPNKIMDAMSLALPCVTAPSAAMQELLTTDEIIYIGSRTPAALASAIKAALQQPETTRETGRKGYQALQNRFSQKAFEDRVGAIFMES